MSGRPWKESKRYEVLAAVRRNPRATIRELMEMTGITTSVVAYHLNKLEMEGVLYRDHYKARSIYMGGEPQRIVKPGPKPESCPRYSRKNYEKKTLAGRKGRGVSAGTSVRRDADIEARIEEIGRRNDAQSVGHHDVIRAETTITRGMRGSRIG